MLQHTIQQVMSPRGSAQASRTGDDTKISQNDVSKRDPYSGALRDSALLVLIMLCKICYESQTKYYDAEAQFLFFIAVCFLNIVAAIRSLMDIGRLLDEVTKLKTELQNMSSGVPQEKKSNEPCKVQMLQVKEEPKSSPKPEKVHVTKEPDQQKIQKVTINLLTTKTQSEKDCKSGLTSKDEKLKDEKAKDKVEKHLKRKCERSTEVWKYCLGFAEGGYKHTNPVCGAMKYRTFYVGNLSFKAKASDIQQAFEKNLSMKVDSVVIARDSTGKSRGCAFVTLRWKEFHERNPGYNRDKEPASQDTLWTEHLSNIMSQQSVCERQIYVEDARSQRRS